MITYSKPHKEAFSDTLSRWIKGKLSNAWIAVTIFQAHSCRAASTSKTRQQGMKMSEILKRGCWSKENTFIKFYDKDIIKSNTNNFDYSSVVLSKWETVFKIYSSGYTKVLHIKLVWCEKYWTIFIEHFDK